METVPTKSARANERPPVLLACIILNSGTKIGPVRYGKGARLQLPEDHAKALAALTPPAVRIDGI